MIPATQDTIAKKRRIAEMLASDATSTAPVGHWTQAVARALQGGVSGAMDANLDRQSQQREAYDRTYEEGAMQRQAQQRLEMAQQLGIEGDDVNRFALTGKLPDPQTPGEAPSSVREWQHFNSLSPEDQQRFLIMKRSSPYLDIGTQFVQPNQVNPAGPPNAVVQKDLAGAEIAKGEGQNIAKTRAELPESQLRTDMVTDNIARLKSQAELVKNAEGLPNVVGGLWQTYAPNISENSLNASTDLENLKVKISGVVLQSMRDMSKTGGAVGQVTEREWPRLENMIANLDTKQGLPQFKKRLDEVIAYADNVTKQIRAAYEADLRTAQGGGPVLPAPQQAGQMGGGQPQQPGAQPQQPRPDPLGLFGN